jgi:hypothetical protein
VGGRWKVRGNRATTSSRESLAGAFTASQPIESAGIAKIAGRDGQLRTSGDVALNHECGGKQHFQAHATDH